MSRPMQALPGLVWIVGLWMLAFTALLIYWNLAESAQTGQQHADPWWPCAFIALYPAALGRAVWLLVDAVRLVLARQRRAGRPPRLGEC